MKSINGKKMKELQDKKMANTIDVDSEVEFKKVHIKGAINIPHDKRDFTQKVQKSFSKKDENVVLCANTNLSSKLDSLGRELEKAGYKNVYQYQAGPSDWKKSNLAIQNRA